MRRWIHKVARRKTAPKKVLRAVGYIRVSTDMQAEKGYSIENQDYEIKNYVESKHMTLVVDPPRAGLAASVPADIVKSGAQRMVYVSCDPATLARDIARLQDCGMQLERVQPVDMFPQTFRVECVCLMSKA